GPSGEGPRNPANATRFVDQSVSVGQGGLVARKAGARERRLKMTDSFWDRKFDYEAFKKTKKNIDAQIEEFIAEIEKQGPMQVDDLVNRNEVLVSIRDALGILDKKLQALMRHGIQALSDEDKMVV